MSNDTMHTDGHSAFDMPELLESLNKGVNRWNTDQMFPISGNMNGNAVGSGNASGTTTFQFQDNVSWWSPKQSYFNLRLKFTVGNGGLIGNNQNILTSTGVTVPLANPDYVTYCDNFVCTLFTQIQSFINSQSVDIVTTPWIIDTALGYSKAHWNFIKTYANMTRMGEPLSTRLLNVTQNGGIVEVAFRPCISLFDVSLFPPGAQFRFDFIWAASAINAFESLLKTIQIGSSSGQYQILVQDFSFYKCTVQPSPNIHLPSRGVIDLCPAVANQYFAVNSTQLQQQITLPGTTNRILIVWQDLSTNAVTPAVATSTTISAPADNITGVGTGYTPATSFTTTFLKQNSGTANQTFSGNTTKLTQLYIILPELGIQCPKPQYTFNIADNRDYIRAYSDWAHICQGTYDNMEGSLPFGNNDPSTGIALSVTGPTGVSLGVGGVTSQPGDRENYQQLWSLNTALSAAGVVPSSTLNQLSRWGWSGTRPGPIFAFPVIRPEYKHVSQGTLYATFNENVNNACATVIATYSLAIAVEDTGNGIYSYSMVTGV